MAATTATITLAIGPAAETIAMPTPAGRSAPMFTGTGLPQPNPATRKTSAPTGSMWLAGFRLTRPSARGR